MSSEGGFLHNKRSAAAAAAAAASDHGSTKKPKAFGTAVDGLQGLPTVCRLTILNFLGEEDLTTMTLVSKQFHEDSHHPAILVDIIPVFLVEATKGSKARLINLLVEAQAKSLFQRYHHIRVLNSNRFELSLTTDILRIVEKIDGVKSLDLSYPTSGIKPDKTGCTGIPWVLSGLFPQLREINLSHIWVHHEVLEFFAEHCPLLEKVIWHGNAAETYADGRDLHRASNLKAIFMDDSDFKSWDVDDLNEFSDLDQVRSRNYLFRWCRKNLEHVSIRNARIRDRGPGEKSLPFSQNALIKFVRNAPSLRWFRSNLSPENMNMLRAERPEITLLN